MIPEKVISAVKQIPITDYLQTMGYCPADVIGAQWVYFSPLSKERTPSFFVHPEQNIWNDFSADERGDIIRLVRILQKLNFQEAVAHLQQLELTLQTASFSFSGYSSTHSGIEVKKVKALENRALLQYIESRMISRAIAQKYLWEVYHTIDGQYRPNGRPYFALCFANDQGGYELRNKNFKGCISPKSITTFTVAGSNQINLFEGFMDFLSAMVHFGKQKPTHTTIVLNSLSFLDQIIPLVSDYRKVNLFFDIDRAGIQATQKVMMLHPTVHDCSLLYSDHKDFNQFLMHS